MKLAYTARMAGHPEVARFGELCLALSCKLSKIHDSKMEYDPNKKTQKQKSVCKLTILREGLETSKIYPLGKWLRSVA